ncbi:MAG: Fic family protein [Planctomycetota bacterium]
MPLKVDDVTKKVLATANGKAVDKALGTATAKKLVEMILNVQLKPQMGGTDEKAAVTGADTILGLELKIIADAGKTVTRLMTEMGGAKLAPQIAGNKMDETKYSAATTDANALKAAKWICSASNSDKKNLGTVAPQLAKILEESAKKSTINSYQHVVMLNKVLVPKPSADVRGVATMGGKLPSSVTGARLLEIAMETLSKKTPGAAGCAWEDLACHLLGTTLRTHGFPDGNGRTARALYALAFLKGNKPFVAIERKLEDKLSDLG